MRAKNVTSIPGRITAGPRRGVCALAPARYVRVVAAIVILALALTAQPVLAGGESTGEGTTVERLVYVARKVYVRNVESGGGSEPINRVVPAVLLVVEPRQDRVLLRVEPLPVELFREEAIHYWENMFVMTNETLQESIRYREWLLEQLRTNTSFVERQYQKYLEGFTVDPASLTTIYTLAGDGSVLEHPEMGFLPLYSPYPVEEKTVKRYNSTYYGCPVQSAGLTGTPAPPGHPGDREGSLYLVSLSFSCPRKPESAGGPVGWAQVVFRGHYLYSARRLVLPVGGGWVLWADEVLPTEETSRLLASVPGYDPERDDWFALLMLVAIGILLPVAGYYVWRRSGGE